MGIDQAAEKEVTHEMRAQGLVAIATLSLLPPRVSPAMQQSILSVPFGRRCCCFG